MPRQRILYLLPGPVPPPTDPRASRYYHLSEAFEGDVLSPVWLKGPNEIVELLGDDAYPVYREGRFNLHFSFLHKKGKVRQVARRFGFYIREGLRIHRETGPLKVVLSYGAGVTGAAALLLSGLTGAKFVVEVPGVPESMNRLAKQVPSWLDRAGQRIFEWSFVAIVRRADRAKLLYPSQLSAFPALRNVPTSVFHNLVPAHLIEPAPETDDRYLLCVGFPWYRKGVDLLIRAFREIADDFPEHRLRLVGAGLDNEYLRALAGDCERIEFQRPVAMLEVFRLMSRCSVFVLPSRSEAMGRVLLEAMAARRPIVAAAVDGIPHYLHDGFNGLLFEPENHLDLAKKLRMVLEDRDLAWKLAKNAHQHMHAELDEKAHVRAFRRMIEDTLARRATQPSPAFGLQEASSGSGVGSAAS